MIIDMPIKVQVIDIKRIDFESHRLAFLISWFRMYEHTLIYQKTFQMSSIYHSIRQPFEAEVAEKFLNGTYSEVPNRRACSLRFFRFSFHPPACNFSCNKQKIPPCSFINLLSKKAGRMDFFSNPARLFRSAHILGTSEQLPLLVSLYSELFSISVKYSGQKVGYFVYLSYFSLDIFHNLIL